MNRIQALISDWDSQGYDNTEFISMPVSMRMRDIARIRALCDLYLSLSEQGIVRQLLSLALDELEEALPYVQGEKISAEDESGDPVYEDVGLTSRFEELTHQYYLQFLQESDSGKV